VSTVTLNNPRAIALNARGTIFFSDSSNNRISMLIPATGRITTIAGGGSALTGLGTNVGFSGPWGLVLGPGERLYVGDYGFNVVRMIALNSGVAADDDDVTQPLYFAPVTVVAGGGGPGATTAGFADGIGTNATFNQVRGMALSRTGALIYVCDANNALIRQVDTVSGLATVLAGGGSTLGTAQGFVNGVGSAALFKLPHALALSPDGGTLVVADLNNNALRAITLATAAVRTLAGGTAGGADGVGTAAQMTNPCSVAYDAAGTLWFTDLYRLRKAVAAAASPAPSPHATRTASATATQLVSVSPTYAPLPLALTNIAGGGRAAWPGYADGPGVAAAFNAPNGVAATASTVFVADTSNHMIRAVDLASTNVSRFAGWSAGYINMPGNLARYNSPRGIAADAAGGTLVVADTTNNDIRRISVATASV
jgi:sugar lactone lactonase YvrE